MYGIQPADSANMFHVNLVVPPLGCVYSVFKHRQVRHTPKK